MAAGEALPSPSVTRRVVEEFARVSKPSRPPSADLAELSNREREALNLVARRLSNGELAARLYLSEATIKTHVSHLLDKLHLRDRVKLVVFAYEIRLVTAGTG